MAEPPPLITGPTSSQRTGPTTRQLAIGLFLGLVIRLLLLPLPGSPDVGSWKMWTFAGAFDATSLYGVGGTPPERRMMHWRGIAGTTEYPPLAIYEMSLVGRAYRAIDPAFEDTPTLTALVKTPGILLELVFVVALLTWGRARLGGAASWIALAFWLNPAIVLNGAALGYLDAEMAVPAALAIIAGAAGAPAVAGALLAAAIMTKAQAIFVAPAVLFATLTAQRRGAGDSSAAMFAGSSS
ncbi:MAG: hypothetical protein ABI652_04525, partial [Acidobacteriota bacterium]